MFPASRRSRRALVVLLLLAPLLELAETLLSPLRGGSTADDLRAIAAHQPAFVVSVLFGIAATVLYVPAFLGLAVLSRPRARKLSAVAGAVAVLSMLGFMGVRMLQAFELQAVRQNLPTGLGAQLVDGAGGTPLGTVFLVLFLGGSVIGVPLLAVAVWRARLAPIPAVVLFLVFPFVALLVPGHMGPVVSHAVLLAGLGWIGLALTRERAAAEVPAASVSAVPAT